MQSYHNWFHRELPKCIWCYRGDCIVGGSNHSRYVSKRTEPNNKAMIVAKLCDTPAQSDIGNIFKSICSHSRHIHSYVFIYICIHIKHIVCVSCLTNAMLTLFCSLTSFPTVERCCENTEQLSINCMTTMKPRYSRGASHICQNFM